MGGYCKWLLDCISFEVNVQYNNILCCLYVPVFSQQMRNDKLLFQAPESMKAVLQALYLLTTALGNLIDLVVVASLSKLFHSQVRYKNTFCYLLKAFL